MKTLFFPLLATALAVAFFFAAEGLTAPPQAVPPPAIAPSPGGTSVEGSVGLAFYENVIYLVRDTNVTRLDAATIPAGHMMTLDGRIVPLPGGVQFPQATIPKPGAVPGAGSVQKQLR